jgi:anti-anti-sigma regulatory factor
MSDAIEGSGVRTRGADEFAVVYAADYLNKISGERIERECRKQIDSGIRRLIINFKETILVNSIGVSILLGLIDVAGESGARLVFTDVNSQTVQLFDMLGLTKHVALVPNEEAAIEELGAARMA